MSTLCASPFRLKIAETSDKISEGHLEMSTLSSSLVCHLRRYAPTLIFFLSSAFIHSIYSISIRQSIVRIKQKKIKFNINFNNLKKSHL